jgi:flagellar basal body-associated protein FliL
MAQDTNPEVGKSDKIRKPLVILLAIIMLTIGAGVGFGIGTFFLNATTDLEEEEEEEEVPQGITVDAGRLLLRYKQNSKTVTHSVSAKVLLKPGVNDRSEAEIRDALIDTFHALSEIPLISANEISEEELLSAIDTILDQKAPWIEKTTLKKISMSPKTADEEVHPKEEKAPAGSNPLP